MICIISKRYILAKPLAAIVSMQDTHLRPSSLCRREYLQVQALKYLTILSLLLVKELKE